MASGSSSRDSSEHSSSGRGRSIETGAVPERCGRPAVAGRRPVLAAGLRHSVYLSVQGRLTLFPAAAKRVILYLVQIGFAG